MIKCLANRVMEFDNGEQKVKTTIGFCELPNWVAQTKFYELGVIDGSIKPFDTTSPKEQEEIIKANEKLEELQRKHAELEEKIEALEAHGKEKSEALKAEIADLEGRAEELKASSAAKNKK